MVTATAWRTLATVLLVVGVALRLSFLNADPSYHLWVGYITDEGRWTAVARNLVLFGEHTPTPLSLLHLAVAPLFQVGVLGAFALLGVDFWSARLFSAVSGAALLVLMARVLRTDFTFIGRLLVLSVLALQPDLVFLSRVAIPETSAMLVHFIAFALLLNEPLTRRMAFIAGLVTAAGVAMKGTTLPIVPIFAAITMFGALPDGRLRLRRAVTFCLGAVSPGLLWFVAIVAGLGWQDFASTADGLSRFADLSGPYRFAALLIENEYVQTSNYLLLVSWAIGLMLYARRADLNHRAGRIYIGSGLWAGGWILVGSAIDYFPARYFFSVMIPLTLHAGAGLCLLATARTDICHLRGCPTVRRFVTAVALVLPTAIALAPLMTALLATVDENAYRLSARLALVATTALVLGMLVSRHLTSQVRLEAIALFPVLVASLWIICSRVGLLHLEFWNAVTLRHAVTWLLLLSFAGVLVWVASASLSRRNDARTLTGHFIGGLAAAVLFFAAIVELIPSYGGRSYTIRQASIELGTSLAREPAVLSVKAESMFLANRLRFVMMRMPEKQTTYVVTAFDDLDAVRFGEYAEMQRYELYVSPHYGRSSSVEPSDAVVKIWHLNETAQTADKRTVKPEPNQGP